MHQRPVRASRDSPRRRMIQPFHRSEQDTLHRMFNAVQPDSYVRPHRHLDPPKAEAWIVLRGAVVFFTFEEDGAIRDCIELRASGPTFGVDLVPSGVSANIVWRKGVWHCLSLALQV